MAVNESAVLAKAYRIDHETWRESNWRELQSVYPDVPPDELEQYVRDVFFSPGISFTSTGFANRDGLNGHVSVFNSTRRTVGADGSFVDPESDDMPRIFMFGDSRMFGVGLDDRGTLPSKLQCLLDQADVSARVVNCGIIGNTLMNILSRIKSVNFSEKDIIALFLTLYAHRFPDRNIRTRQNYYVLLKCIVEEAAARGLKILIFKYPDIRRLKRTTSLEYYFQRHVRLPKVYCRISPDFIPSPLQQVDFIDTQDALEEVPRGISSFWDHDHLGPVANAAVASFIFPHIRAAHARNNWPQWGMLPSNSVQKQLVSRQMDEWLAYCRQKTSEQLAGALQKTLRLYEGYRKFERGPGESIGAIVANCNPFTYGHAHLVSEALKHVSYLYIFIVSEDRSFFSFEHRYEMVRNHYAGNTRILVLPSGNLMGSALTCPEYFERNLIHANTSQYSVDIAYFKDIVTKIFHIDTRFVGTEPNSSFMNGYNEALKRILPESGINVVEIERSSDITGRPISASEIRKAIHNNNLRSLEGNLPDATIEVIRRCHLSGSAF